MKCCLIFLIASYKNTCKLKHGGAAVAHTVLGPSPPVHHSQPSTSCLSNGCCSCRLASSPLVRRDKASSRRGTPCPLMPTHPDTPTWGYPGHGPWTKKIFCISKGPELLGNKWRESSGILFKKKKNDKNFLGNSGNRQRQGFLTLLCQAAF